MTCVSIWNLSGYNKFTGWYQTHLKGSKSCPCQVIQGTSDGFWTSLGAHVPLQRIQTLTPADGLSEDAFMWVSQGTVPKSFQDPQIKPANMTGISGNMQSLEEFRPGQVPIKLCLIARTSVLLWKAMSLLKDEGWTDNPYSRFLPCFSY